MKSGIAWAAGLFERGGSANRRDGKKPRLQIKSNSGETIQRFHDAVGAGVIYGPYDYEYKDGSTRKPYYMWVAEGEFALRVARMLKPHLSSEVRHRIESTFKEVL